MRDFGKVGFLVVNIVLVIIDAKGIEAGGIILLTGDVSGSGDYYTSGVHLEEVCII